MQDVGGKGDTRAEHKDLAFSWRYASVDPLDTVSLLEDQSRAMHWYERNLAVEWERAYDTFSLALVKVKERDAHGLPSTWCSCIEVKGCCLRGARDIPPESPKRGARSCGPQPPEGR
jgi:hypothetical protein